MRTFRNKLSPTIEIGLLVLLLVLGDYIRLPILEKVLVFPVNLRRIGLDVFTVAYILRRIRGKAPRPLTRLSIVFFGVMGLWLVWGCAGAVISPYVVSTYDGLSHMSTLAWNVLAVYCVYECCYNRQRTQIFLWVLGLCCGVIALAALTENFVGWHMKASRYDSLGLYADGVPAGLHVPSLFSATLFEANPNNLSAMVSILLPTLFVTGGEKRWMQGVKLLLVLLTVYGLIANDANLTIIAAMAAMVVYILLRRCDWIANGIMALGSVAVIRGVGGWITSGLLAVKQQLWPPVEGLISDDSFKRFGAQMEDAVKAVSGDVGAQLEAKSVGTRWGLILDSLDMTVSTKFLGVGPIGFGWFESHGARTKLVDPHCWPLEVLSQYGIVVFLSYFGTLAYMYIRMVLAQLKNRDPLFAQVIAMCTAFLFASIAPSSFLRFTYAWILPGLCLTMLDAKWQEPHRNVSD